MKAVKKLLFFLLFFKKEKKERNTGVGDHGNRNTYTLICAGLANKEEVTAVFENQSTSNNALAWLFKDQKMSMYSCM